MAHLDKTPAQIRLSGALTIAEFGEVASIDWAEYADKPLQCDFSQLTSVDSIVISLMLEWMRQARTHRIDIRFLSLPTGVAKLLFLYGVSDFIPQA